MENVFIDAENFETMRIRHPNADIYLSVIMFLDAVVTKENFETARMVTRRTINM